METRNDESVFFANVFQIILRYKSNFSYNDLGLFQLQWNSEKKRNYQKLLGMIDTFINFLVVLVSWQYQYIKMCQIVHYVCVLTVWQICISKVSKRQRKTFCISALTVMWGYSCTSYKLIVYTSSHCVQCCPVGSFHQPL